MVRAPMKSETDNGLKKGPWTEEEDKKLKDYVEKQGHGSWQTLPKKAGLNRCGKSCRLRWTNYLRPHIKRGNFSPQEVQTIIDLHSTLGNKWAMIATRLPGRTDNEIKNYWNTHLRKKLLSSGIDPNTHQLITHFSLHPNLTNFPTCSLENLANNRLLQNLLQLLSSNQLPSFMFGSNAHNLVNANGVINPTVELSSPPLPTSDNNNNSRPPENHQRGEDMEWYLPGLTPATSEICSYDEWLSAAVDDESSSGSFWKDVFNESFP